MRSLFQIFRPFRWQLLPVVLASVLEMFFNAQLPMSVKFMIDRALLGHDQRMMLVVLGALAASTVVVSATSLWRDYFYARIVARIVSSLRERMFEHLQRLSMDFYSRIETGDVMSRFSNDVSAVETGIAAGVLWGLQPLLDLVLAGLLVISMEWRLATLGILLCPICVLGPRLLSRRASEASVAKQEQESAMMSSLQETLMAPNLVRAFNLQSAVSGRFRQRAGQLLGASIRLGFMNSLMERSASFGTLVLQAVVMGISGYLAFRGTITIGTFASFQALFVSFSYSFMYLAQYMPNLIRAGGGVARIEDLLKETPSVEDEPESLELRPLQDAIEFENVRFSYTAERTNLDGVSLRIPRGSSVALVGPSGSGKSTVLNLLLRFYDPDSGRVAFDHTDLKKVKQASLRDFIAVVFQEGFLFNTTVRENIALGRPGAADGEIVEAAKAAEIHDFITSLPDGYDTMAGERGSRFSGGQRQRIAIARAVLRKPSVLLLDEATSALDPATEHAINLTLERIARGRTMISVTHRLRSVVNMDRIFLFHQGGLAEQGRHDELLQAGGIYAKMWQKQSGVQVGDGAERATVDAVWLADFPLMKGVRLETLREVTNWFSTQHFAADRVIIQQGEPGNTFYILVRGKVDILRDEGERTVSVGKLEDGDCFGEMALLSSQPRNATVKALTDCVCLSLSRDLFNRLLADEPELRKNIHQLALTRGAR